MTQIDRKVGLIGGVALKVPCKAATTTNITLSGEQTIDGVSCVTDDRVLVKDQTTASENGIYLVDTGTWSRAPDWDGANDVKKGTLVYVHSGTTNTGFWFVSTADDITIGTTSVTIARASSVLAAVSTFIQTLLDDDTVAAAAATLDVGGLNQANTWNADQTLNASLKIGTGVVGRNILFDAPDGSSDRQLVGRVAGVTRWSIGIGDGTQQVSSGPRFEIQRYNPSGNLIGNVLLIRPTDGAVQVGLSPTGGFVDIDVWNFAATPRVNNVPVVTANASVETVTTTNVITAAESGKTFFLSAVAGFASTLPAPAAGLHYKFIVATSPTSNGYTIATTNDDNIIIGGINELEVDTADDGPYSAVGDLITFVANVAVVGDWLEVISDGTSWFLTGQTNADGGVTIGST